MAIKFGNDKPNNLRGTSSVDFLYGFGADDQLHGKGSGDFLYGGSEGDSIFGEGGDDWLSGNTGWDFLSGSKGEDRLYGGEGQDTLDAGEDDDSLRGGDGDDSLSAGSGDDTLRGETGNDLASGGKGKDEVEGGDGADTLHGDGGNDRIYGDNGNDELFGGSGKNKLFGGNGDDILAPGESGKDRLDGGSGFDTVSYTAFSVGVIVNLPEGIAGGGAADDRFASIEKLVGTNLADTLTPISGGTAFGHGGDDVLSSFSGAILRGDDGLDTLNGDTAKNFHDIFWLQFERGPDLANGFETGDDKLRVSNSDFAGIGTTLTAEELVNDPTGNQAVGTNAQFIFQQNTSQLWFDTDGTGGAAPVLIATIAGTGSLSLSDFDLI